MSGKWRGSAGQDRRGYRHPGSRRGRAVKMTDSAWQYRLDGRFTSARREKQLQASGGRGRGRAGRDLGRLSGRNPAGKFILHPISAEGRCFLQKGSPIAKWLLPLAEFGFSKMLRERLYGATWQVERDPVASFYLYFKWKAMHNTILKDNFLEYHT